MLPNNFSQIAERIQRQNNRSLKELFKNDIILNKQGDLLWLLLNVKIVVAWIFNQLQ